MSTAAVTTRTGAVLADLLPVARHRYAVDTALVLGGAALTGIAAQIAVPVPGSPVPVTGQTFAALLVGTALGTRRGFLALAVYTLVGVAGVPWFSAGSSGPGGASFGYVLGMLLAATVAGALARRGGDRSVARTAGTMVAGSLIIYAVGVPYLAVAADLTLGQAVAAGLTPFLLGDALKAALAMGLLPASWKLVGRQD
ncbi:biotin transporter BioY [Streptomyces sp. NBC_01498]|uniref:biotin transporter BioY n=1 Tax=Streptomyces sp. NBC_01498 TaxID=2975870 RepID=UPI002E7B4CFC|nr:biotin transporter BioY [Streptomyces sp. NBC_01498]WTL26902.1 biotin transporter BioY [Streptomyces sp. NBC_01498]